jgi:hypothetical protein
MKEQGGPRSENKHTEDVTMLLKATEDPAKIIKFG